jgi:DNA-binding NarL/FixJ family response regulator
MTAIPTAIDTRAADAPLAQAAPAGSFPAVEPVSEPAGVPAKRTTLLLADDHGIVREGIAAFCRTKPEYLICGECADGESALAMILDLAPDFAILDINMPKLSGLEVVRHVRRANCPTKLIILSIQRETGVIQELFRSGADGYVLKDGPARHLFDAIAYVRDGGTYLTPLLRPNESKGRGQRDPLADLSAREYEVFCQLVDGRRPRDIAAILEISPKTVDTYRSSIMRKLKVDGIAGLVRFAINRTPGT